MSRNPNYLVFDRIKKLAELDTPQNLIADGEYDLVTKCIDPHINIVATVDYAFEFPPGSMTCNDNCLELIRIIVEAKRPTTVMNATRQAAAYILLVVLWRLKMEEPMRQFGATILWGWRGC